MLRLQKLISSNTNLKLYKAFILPHFYFWGTRNKEELEALNKRILRFMFSDYSSF